MKSLFQVFCLLLICSVHVMGYCNESYRAHFDVRVEDDLGKVAGAGGPIDVVSGVPQIFDMGDKCLTLLFTIEPLPSTDYTLTVSLSCGLKELKNA